MGVADQELRNVFARCSPVELRPARVAVQFSGNAGGRKMWQERERRQQRVRLLVFVLTVSTLFVAWWRLDSDPQAQFSPFDSWFTQTPTPRPAAPAAVPSPDAGRRGVPDVPPNVGTTGQGGSRARNYQVRKPVDGDETTGDVRPPRAAEPQPRPTRLDGDHPSRPIPCDPRAQTPQELADAARAGLPPCAEIPLPGRGSTTAPGAQPAPPAPAR